MNYKITVTTDRASHSVSPRWDILPVAKLTCTDDAITQPIFAQAVLCYRPDDGLHVRMWAFETDKAYYPEESMLCAAFALNPLRPEDYLLVQFGRKGIVSAYTVIGGVQSEADAQGFGLSLFSGEDLQGEYWGGAFVVPQGLMKARFGVSGFLGGETIRGNLMHAGKASGDNEYATLYPAKGDISVPGDYGTFELIGY